MAEVARELDIVEQTLNKWVMKYREDQEDSFVGSENLKPKDKAEYEKDKQIQDLKEENAFLKKLWASSQKSRNNL